MDTIKKILTISLLVGLLSAANSATAQLAIDLTPVAGAPIGYRTFDIEATTATELGAMELVVDTAAPASIYQIGTPSPIEASGGTYDTYLTMPVNWQVYGSAVDINSDPQVWTDQNLNKAWGPQAGENSGSGTFQVGRLTLANWASASYTIKGWEGGQGLFATTLAGTLDPVVGLSVVESRGSGISKYDRYFDFYADINTNLGAMELLFNTDSSSGIYQVSTTADDPDDADAFDSYVSIGYPTSGEQPANTTVAGAAVDIPGSSGVQTFNAQDIDLAWAPTGGIQTGHGTYHVGRVTVANTASGSWTMKGWQGGDPDEEGFSAISGDFTVADLGLSAVEGSGSGVSGYDRYLDFYAATSTNLGVMELLLDTDASGDIYQVSLTADDPDDADAFDSYVSTGYPADGEQPANTTLAGAAVDIAGSSGVQTFTDQNIDLAWGPTGGTQTGDGLFHIARVTLADTATGAWTLKGWQGGYPDAAEISGTIVAGSVIVRNRGDVTGEGFVGADDLVAILTNWGASGAGVTWEMGDIAPYGDGSDPGDDFIGADDYVEVLTFWGTTYPPEPGEAVPEPAALGLLLVGALMGILRRR